MRARLPRYESLFERRRARRERGDANRPYTFELAALHLELLIAMAAVDGDICAIEVDNVLGFIDRTSLVEDDRRRLEELASVGIQRPPRLDVLGRQLSSFAGRPALARRMAEDLAKVAAADKRADPREETLLRFVCDSLNVPHVPIRIIGEATDVGATRVPNHASSTRSAAVARAEAIAASRRVRSAVRSALEASYESRTGP